MINLEDRHALHEFIILELAIRSLQQDFHKLEQLKMQKFYTAWTDQILKTLYPYYLHQRSFFTKRRIRIVQWRKVNEHFSEVQIATSGEDLFLQYANLALKQEVEKLLMVRFLL